MHVTLRLFLTKAQHFCIVNIPVYMFKWSITSVENVYEPIFKTTKVCHRRFN